MNDQHTPKGGLDLLVFNIIERQQCEFGGDDDPFAYTQVDHTYVYDGEKMFKVHKEKTELLDTLMKRGKCENVHIYDFYSNAKPRVESFQLNGKEYRTDDTGVYSAENHLRVLDWTHLYEFSVKLIHCGPRNYAALAENGSPVRGWLVGRTIIH